jgi:hypothetical protein
MKTTLAVLTMFLGGAQMKKHSQKEAMQMNIEGKLMDLLDQIDTDVKITKKLKKNINSIEEDNGGEDTLISLNDKINLHSYKANVLEKKSMFDTEREAVHEKMQMETLEDENHSAIKELEDQLKGIHESES